jgi:ADP-ribose pyrophosphatase YjhB (NUDIX family)
MPKGVKQPKKESEHSISLNATGLMFNADGTSLLLVYNTNHKKWMPPGGHVYIEKGEVPHEKVIEKVRKEAGIACKLHPDFHQQQYTYTTLRGGQKIDRVPEPYCVLYEQQVGYLECGCHWHYDLYYVIEEIKVSKTTKGFAIKWMTLQDIRLLEKEDNVYSDFVKLAEEVFAEFARRARRKP